MIIPIVPVEIDIVFLCVNAADSLSRLYLGTQQHPTPSQLMPHHLASMTGETMSIISCCLM